MGAFIQLLADGCENAEETSAVENFIQNFGSFGLWLMATKGEDVKSFTLDDLGTFAELDDSEKQDPPPHPLPPSNSHTMLLRISPSPQESRMKYLNISNPLGTLFDAHIHQSKI